MTRRPAQIPIREPLAAELVEQAAYVGSPEHKTHKWWGGLPLARLSKDGKVSRPGKQKTTICPLTEKEEQIRATEWVRSALINGQCKYYEGDKVFPKHLWYTENGQTWFGYCLNSIAGQYKAWPIEEEERRAYFDS